MRAAGILATLLLAASDGALAASSMTYNVWAGGTHLAKDTASFESDASEAVVREFTSANYSIRIEGGGRPGAARVNIAAEGSAAVYAELALNSSSTLQLLPPPGGFGPVAGGRVVLMIEAEEWRKSWCGCVARATLVSSAGSVTQTLSAGSFPDAYWDYPIFPVNELAIPLPAAQVMDSEMQLLIQTTIQFAYMRAAPQWTRSGVGGLKIAAFRVFDASGVQVVGFRMHPEGLISEFDPSEWIAPAVEYFNPSYGSYFITHLPQEIADLDSGRTPGWQRTGESLNVWKRSPTGSVEVCRFYGVFGAKSSHVYAARGLGCEDVHANPSWQFEGNVFHAYLPEHPRDLSNEGCPSGNLPVYRLFNNGQGGVPNHRFTTSRAIRDEMVAKGWTPEGNGIGVVMCSPQ